MILVGPSREQGLFRVRLCVYVFWQLSSAKKQSPVQGCNLSSNLEQAIPRLQIDVSKPCCCWKKCSVMVFHQKHWALQGVIYPLPKWDPRLGGNVDSLWLLLKGDSNFLSEVSVERKAGAWLQVVCPYCCKDQLCTWQFSAIHFASPAHPLSWDILPGWPDFQTRPLLWV